MDDVRDPVLPPALTTSIGGPRGRRLRVVERGPLARLAPVVLLLALPLSVAALRQAGCLANGWRGQFPVWRQCAAPAVQALPTGTQAGFHTWQYPAEEIEKLADPRVKAFFLVNPSNPASFAMSAETQAHIVDLVRNRRPDLIILTDDV